MATDFGSQTQRNQRFAAWALLGSAPLVVPGLRMVAENQAGLPTRFLPLESGARRHPPLPGWRCAPSAAEHRPTERRPESVATRRCAAGHGSGTDAGQRPSGPLPCARTSSRRAMTGHGHRQKRKFPAGLKPRPGASTIQSVAGGRDPPVAVVRSWGCRSRCAPSCVAPKHIDGDHLRTGRTGCHPTARRLIRHGADRRGGQ
jgi:hypothetical protein